MKREQNEQNQNDQKQIAKECLMDAVGNVDEEMLSEVEKLRAGAGLKVRGGWRKWALPLAACALLLIGSLTTYAVLNSGGMLETGKDKPTDQTNSTYKFSVSEDIRIPMKEIHGDVVKLTAEMEERFQKQEPWSSTYPGWLKLPFETEEEALTFIGYKKMNFPHLNGTPKQISVEALGNPVYAMEVNRIAQEKGISQEEAANFVDIESEEMQNVKLVSLRLYAEYQTESTLNYTSTAILNTEYADENTGISGIAWNGVDFTSHMQIENGREFYVMNAEGFAGEWLGQQVFWQENNVLYLLHLRYKEQDQKQADEVMLEWMNAF